MGKSPPPERNVAQFRLARVLRTGRGSSRLLAHDGTLPTGRCAGLNGSKKCSGVSWRSVQDGQEMDKSAFSPIRCPAKLLLELVELMGIEPMTS